MVPTLCSSWESVTIALTVNTGALLTTARVPSPSSSTLTLVPSPNPQIPWVFVRVSSRVWVLCFFMFYFGIFYLFSRWISFHCYIYLLCWLYCFSFLSGEIIVVIFTCFYLTGGSERDQVGNKEYFSLQTVRRCTCSYFSECSMAVTDLIMLSVNFLVQHIIKLTLLTKVLMGLLSANRFIWCLCYRLSWLPPIPPTLPSTWLVRLASSLLVMRFLQTLRIWLLLVRTMISYLFSFLSCIINLVIITNVENQVLVILRVLLFRLY